MSVKTCYPEGYICKKNRDCCIDDGIYCNLVVSMRSYALYTATRRLLLVIFIGRGVHILLILKLVGSLTLELHIATVSCVSVYVLAPQLMA